MNTHTVNRQCIDIIYSDYAKTNGYFLLYKKNLLFYFLLYKRKLTIEGRINEVTTKEGIFFSKF